MPRKKTPIERLKLWTECLCRPEGTTYRKLNSRLCKAPGEDFHESLRQDLVHIRKLLAGRQEQLQEDGGKEKTFRLSGFVDLAELHKRQKSELIYLLTHTRGFLPAEFIESLSEEFREAQDGPEQTIVSFETEYDLMEGMDFYPEVYRAITDRRTLRVSYHRMHRPAKELTAFICPDFLKQYHNSWYVFGMVREGEDVTADFVPGRMPLAAIDGIAVADQTAFPYQATHRDYEAYFSEIIGIERDENCPQEPIRLRVSSHILDRIMTTPLHPTQERCKALDAGRYKGIELKVRRNKELIRLLLSYGSDMEVVSPAILRRQMMRELQRMLTQYQG